VNLGFVKDVIVENVVRPKAPIGYLEILPTFWF